MATTTSAPHSTRRDGVAPTHLPPTAPGAGTRPARYGSVGLCPNTAGPFERGGQQSIEPSAGPPEPGPRGRRPPPSKPRGAEGPSVSFQRNNFVWLRRIRRCLSPPRLRPRHPGAPLRAAADRKPRILLTCASRTQMASLSPKPHFKDRRTWMSLDSGLQAAFAVDRLCDPREVAPL